LVESDAKKSAESKLKSLIWHLEGLQKYEPMYSVNSMLKIGTGEYVKRSDIQKLIEKFK